MSQNITSSITLGPTSQNVSFTGNWTTKTDTINSHHLYNATDTWSNQKGATAILKFYGNAVEYWSNKNPNHGPCDISLDNSHVATASSNGPNISDPFVMYSTSNLSLDNHTLVITVDSDGDNNRCEVDRFVVNITSTDTSRDPFSNSSSSTTGPIIGGILGGVAVICLLAFILWWRRRKMNEEKLEMSPVQQERLAMPYTLPTQTPSHPGSSSALIGSRIATKEGRSQIMDQDSRWPSPREAGSGTENTREPTESDLTTGPPPPAYHN